MRTPVQLPLLRMWAMYGYLRQELDFVFQGLGVTRRLCGCCCRRPQGALPCTALLLVLLHGVRNCPGDGGSCKGKAGTVPYHMCGGWPTSQE
jgi:hypothetical protein